ncbi:hypothetical protein EfmAA610_23470 [Enterococcus faecium]|nr:hypothetical protein EfmAA610_23470 [Enterococcus faecium]
MATKHDLILEYIESLPVGNRISVRSIAKELNVSEGTAYRAIKDAENDTNVFLYFLACTWIRDYLQ